MKWEYKEVYDFSLSVKDLNALGGDEWQLILLTVLKDFGQTKYLFKRPLPEEEE